MECGKKILWCLVDRSLSFNSRGLCHNLPIGMQSWTSGWQLVQNLRAVLLQGGSRRPREGVRDPCSASSLHHHVLSFCDSATGVAWLLGQANPLSEKMNYDKPALKICCQCFSIQRWFSFHHGTWRLHVNLKGRNRDLDGRVCRRVVPCHFVA